MARRRKRRRWWPWLLAGCVALLVAYLVLSPLLIAWRISAMPPGSVGYPTAFEERLLPIVLGAFLAGWTFLFGGAVGSFLNVVAWRMPRGESIVRRPSHCPWCNANIAVRDNLPVFGWLLLGGRCRNCRLRISPRYPIVEATVGATFLALGVAEVFTGGTNLPDVPIPPAFPRDLISIVTSPDATLLETFAFHCLLLSLLTACALIRYDGHRLPTSLVVVGGAAGLALSTVWPALHPVAWRSGAEIVGWPDRWQTGLIGLGAGTSFELITLSLTYPCRRTRSESHLQRWSPLVAPGLVGLFLGWQALVGVLVLGGGLALLAAMLSHMSRFFTRLPLVACYALAALVQIAFWRTLDTTAWWPGSDWPLWQFGVAAAVGVGLAATATCLTHPAQESNYNIDLDDDDGHVSGPHDTTLAFRSSDTDGDSPTEEHPAK